MAGGKVERSPQNGDGSKEVARLLEIKNPLEKSLASFERFVNWGLAVSAGTLLWFVGNFDKFTTRYINTVDDSSFVIKSALPNKWLFVLSMVLLFISAAIFAYFRIKLYYNSYKFDYNRELYAARFKTISEKQKLAKSDPSQAISLLANFDAEFEEAHKQAIAAGAWVGLVNEFIILEDDTKKYLIAATASYILGLFVGVIYLGLFISILK